MVEEETISRTMASTQGKEGTALELTPQDILTRYAEPFARALAVFVRECSASRQGAGDLRVTDPSIKCSDPDDESFARELVKAIKENEALALAGQLNTVDVNSESASKAVATRLRLIIKDRGFTQKKLAEKVGVTPARISHVLNNPDRSKVGTLRKIAEALDIDIHKVL